ncbi:hypothetical protein ILUMI_26022 [Ignelater luminosus]|uniref:Cap-specific mRNA (nucleoside-2'-O-)-methyltransferase 2 n=1 Tax=Ignelater luminosus TaxID=2038154 RepID=A0A8K0C6F4_IGNLU|nr:hypothetical protein ILUMI_26022 [Ignelater luminosus]
MIADDRLIRHTLTHWNFGADLTGDLMKYYNHQVLVNDRSVMLVTADGSVDCMKDPGEQENNVHYLHYCETVTALKVLEKWGNFVLKIFTIFEHGTICLLYLLNCCFANVHIFKPCSSKSGNSEVYVICIGYKGWEVLEMIWPSLIAPYQGFVKTDDTAMFPLESINFEFLQQIEDCSNFFKQLQCHTINENVRHFIGQVENDDEEINKIKINVAERFIKKYRMAFHIPKRHKLITNYEKHKTPIIEEEWDFKLVNVIELPIPNEDNAIKAKIGRALITVTNSKFCNVNFNLCKLNSTNDKNLLEEILPLLSPHYRIIQRTLCENKPQYVYQRTVFYNFMNNLESSADIVLIRIPLLTRFLVGLVYILAQGFTTVTLCRKGVLILQNPIKERVHIVKTFFKAIEGVYHHIDNETNFTADILEIISSELFENGNFDKIICRYNDELFSE